MPTIPVPADQVALTGQELLDTNPDLKAAGVDPFQWFVTYASPTGELRELRVISKPAPAHLPPDWNWEEYLAANKDLRDADYDTQAEAENHYFTYGYYEHRLIRLVPPEGWDAAFYLAKYTDVREHPYYSSWPLSHYNEYGKAEGRIYRESALTLIIDQATKKEIFCTLKIPEGLLCGEYGLGQGGPHIFRLEGNVQHDELHIPDIESVMSITDFGDGQPVACCEHHGRIYKRINGTWRQSYNHTNQTGLVLGIAAVLPMLYAGINFYGQHKVAFIQSGDMGKSWQLKSGFTYSGMDWFNMAAGRDSNGMDIRIAGSKGGHPVVFDAHGVSRWSIPDINGKWWSICGTPDKILWNMGTWDTYEDSVDRAGIIHIYDGSVREVFRTDRPHIHSIKIFNGIRYAIACWDWNAASDKTSLLLKSLDEGYNWSEVTKIPCPHIIGMSFGDGGIYLSGGRKDEYGRVYFYKI